MAPPSFALTAAAAFLASVLFLKFRRRTPTPAAVPKPAPKVAAAKPAPKVAVPKPQLKVAAAKPVPKSATPIAATQKPAAPKAAPRAAHAGSGGSPAPKPPPKPAAIRPVTPKVAEPPTPDLADVWSELDELVTSEPAEPWGSTSGPTVLVDPDLAELDDELLAPPQPRGRDRVDELLEELQRSPEAIVRPRPVPKRPVKRI